MPVLDDLGQLSGVTEMTGPAPAAAFVGFLDVESVYRLQPGVLEMGRSGVASLASER